MANKMLIDAAHPEETRVVVLRGNRVEEFDFEAASKKQLRGNIYLAKVTRVEPSLQAAFVDYGGNRHGFLAFSEIHPDYYQIPVSDRQALIEADAQEEPEEEERRPQRRSRRHRRERSAAADMHRGAEESVSELAGDTSPTVDQDQGRPNEAQDGPIDGLTGDMIEHAQAVHDRIDDDAASAAYAPPAQDASSAPESPATDDAPAPHHAPVESGMPNEDALAATTAALGRPSAASLSPDLHPPVEATPPIEPAAETLPVGDPAIVSDAQVDIGSSEVATPDADAAEGESSEDEESEDEEDVSEHVEQLGGDAMEELPVRAHRHRRQYKIQEVIKRRQVLLVQVVKEERGNKGAAITTYLSLAGRYSVLMPNTAKGGGISRKITDAGDRQRLKSIAQDLEVPEGMGVILRTAGAARTKPEVKRDFEYLMRMWETVRETTLGSQAPTLVYEEGSLIKRAIRDLYNKDVDEVLVAGEAAFREAKEFMRLLMPSHARNVQPWREPQPIFAKSGAETQLDAMFSSHVTLKSGGYLVINQTEALVAIDVNSGRSTREHNIEDTALRTNLEAADEVARQLRLRDLAGLIVVDFIDMEENRNNRAVEKRMKDALKDDRARIQVGRISHFGLLEMSRQRIRTGVLEGSTVVCEHCAGTGMVRSTSSIALHVLRVLEDTLIADAAFNVSVRARATVALYVLNQKRAHLAALEARFGVEVTFAGDETLTGTTYCAVDRGEPATGVPQPSRSAPPYEGEDDDAVQDETDEIEAGEAEIGVDADSETETSDVQDSGDDAEEPRRRRRRRRRGRDRESSGISGDAPQPADDALGLIAGEPASDDTTVTATTDETEAATEAAQEDAPRESRRRRSRRGGRRNREEGLTLETAEPSDDAAGTMVIQTDAMVDADIMPDAAIPKAAMPEVVMPEVGVPEAAELSPAIAPESPIAASTEEPDIHHGMTAVTEPAAQAAPPVGTAEADETPAPVHEPAEHSTMSASPSAVVPVAEAEAASEAARPAKPDLVSSELDPAQPKRSGWWQRAKATLGG